MRIDLHAGVLSRIHRAFAEKGATHILRLITFIVCTFAYSISACATLIERTVVITPSADQVFNNGEYGAGLFWRPTFTLDPFVLSGAGDTIEVTVQFANGLDVLVIGTASDQESVAAIIGFPGGQNTFYTATWEFLGVGGDLLSSSLSIDSYSEAWGIAVSFNPLNLTDSWFSFNGVRFSFTILDEPRLRGLPTVFDTGVIAIQTYGAFHFAPVPEPSTMILLATGLAGLMGLRKRFGKV